IRVGSWEQSEDIKRIAAARRVLGDDVEILTDANGGWSVNQALQALDPLAALAVAWLEQPTDSLDGLAQVKPNAVGVRIRADESVRSAQDVRKLAEMHAVHGVHLKLEKVGTVEKLVAAVMAAREVGLDVALGQMDQGILGCAATGHIAQ